MTKYHAFMTQVRHQVQSRRNKCLPFDVWDCRLGEREDIWALLQHIRQSTHDALPINLYAQCCYGDLPRQPEGWRGEWLRDLPGVQRVYDKASLTTLTMWVTREPTSASSLPATMLCRADLVLADTDVDHWVGTWPEDGLLYHVPSQAFWDAAALRCDQRGVSDGLWRSWKPSAPLAAGGAVAVVGAGIAGLTIAHTLAARGFDVTVWDAFDPFGDDGVHAGHWAAALTPVVAADDNLRSRLSRAGAVLADRLWRQLPAEIGSNCGALQLEKSPDQRRRVDLEQVARGLDMPQWATWLNAAQASEKAGLRLSRSALWLSGAWLIRVPHLLRALASVPRLSISVARVQSVRRQAGQWQLLGATGQVLQQAQAVVLANAFDTPDVLARSELMLYPLAAGKHRLAGLHRLAGEITAIPAAMVNEGPRCIVGGDGYILPAVDGWCVTGGTYVRGAQSSVLTAAGQQENVLRAAQLLSQEDLPQRLQQHAVNVGDLPGWAGWRAVVGGRLPVVGPVPGQDYLYVCTAGASRGLTWSALQAQLLADHLEARLPALETSLLSQISLF